MRKNSSSVKELKSLGSFSEYLEKYAIADPPSRCNEDSRVMNTFYRDERSLNGISFSVLKSALQKYIRRGMTEKALFCAGEIDLFAYADNQKEGERLRSNFFHRLMIIFLEDISTGNYHLWPTLAPLIDNLLESRYRKDRNREQEILADLQRSDVSGQSTFNEILREEICDPVKGLKCSLSNRSIDAVVYAFRIWDQRGLKKNESLSINERGELIFSILSIHLDCKLAKVWFKELANLGEQCLTWLLPLAYVLYGGPQLHGMDEYQNYCREDAHINRWVKNELGEVLEINEDFVFDMHTMEGRRAGRDRDFFLTESSRVIPECEEFWPRDLKKLYQLRTGTFAQLVKDSHGLLVGDLLPKMDLVSHVSRTPATSMHRFLTATASAAANDTIIASADITATATAGANVRRCTSSSASKANNNYSIQSFLKTYENISSNQCKNDSKEGQKTEDFGSFKSYEIKSKSESKDQLSFLLRESDVYTIFALANDPKEDKHFSYYAWRKSPSSNTKLLSFIQGPFECESDLSHILKRVNYKKEKHIPCLPMTIEYMVSDHFSFRESFEYYQWIEKEKAYPFLVSPSLYGENDIYTEEHFATFPIVKSLKSSSLNLLEVSLSDRLKWIDILNAVGVQLLFDSSGWNDAEEFLLLENGRVISASEKSIDRNTMGNCGIKINRIREAILNYWHSLVVELLPNLCDYFEVQVAQSLDDNSFHHPTKKSKIILTDFFPTKKTS